MTFNTCVALVYSTLFAIHRTLLVKTTSDYIW